MESPNKEALPILLVEDSPTDVAIVQKALKKAGILNPLHVCHDGEEAIDFLHGRFSNVGLAILDIHLPKIGGLEVLKEAKRIDPDMVVIMLTSQASMKTAIQSLRRDGAYDYLEKSKEDLPELIEAVRSALETRMVRLQNHWTVPGEGGERIIDMSKIQEEHGLSNREIDVVKCLTRGDSNKEIGDRLFISELTVKGHLKKIYQKMNVHNRATLVSNVLSGSQLGG
jgi:DNA-binding NarL/FixJ family response regulator